MKKLVGLGMLATLLMMPLQMRADEHGRDHDRDDRNGRNSQVQRYYDPVNRDYHQWNDNEQTAYRQYQSEHHRDNDDFRKASKRQQKDYWKWRHQHHEDR
jgi:hypothetical protein